MADGGVLDLYAEDLDKDFGQNQDDGEGFELYDDLSGPNEVPPIGPSSGPPSEENSVPPGSTEGSSNVGSNGIYHHSGSNAGPNHMGRRFQLYVGNLTWWTTDQDIANVMRDIGVNDFQEVKFFENRSNGQSKGFCVVSLGSEPSLRMVLDRLPKKEMHGLSPVVTYPTKQALNQFESLQKTRPVPQPQQNGPPRGPAPGMGVGVPMPPHGGQGMPPVHPGRMMNPNMPGQYRPPHMQQGPPMGPNAVPPRMQFQGPPGGMPMRGPRPEWNRPPMHGGFPPQGPPGGPPQGPPHMQGPPRGPPGGPAQMGGPGGPPVPGGPHGPGGPHSGPAGPHGGPVGPGGPAPHVNPAFFNQPGGPPQHPGGPPMGGPHGPPGPPQQGMNMPPQHGPPPHFAQQGAPRGPWPGPPQTKPQGPFPEQVMVPQVAEVEFEEIMSRNRTVSSSAIARAVSDAAAGEYSSAIETLVTAISLIKQSKVAQDERCKILISSLQDTLHGIEAKSYNRRERSRSRDRTHRTRPRRERSTSRYRERSRDRERDREREREAGYRERSRSRDRERPAPDHYRDDSSSRSARPRKSPETAVENVADASSKRSYYDERYRSSDRDRERDRDRDRERERDRDRDRERDRREEHRSRH